jgi:hypothetical protein
MKTSYLLFLSLVLFISCAKPDEPDLTGKDIAVDSIWVNQQFVANNKTIFNVDYERVDVKIKFSLKLDTNSFNKTKVYFTGQIDTAYSYWFAEDARSLTITPREPLEPSSSCRLFVDVGKNFGRTITEGYSVTIATKLDSTPKFPLISEDSLLTLVQYKTFRYFWDYAHPVSGLARERYGSGDVVTTGGSGFGLMAILVGIERNFITRQAGVDRLEKIVDFLASANRFHGAWSHWLNGTSGVVIPFGTYDNGGDLVETSFMAEGLITVRQYLDPGNTQENGLITKINDLWNAIEWDWYTRGGQNVLYWHWSPNYDWQMNFKINGYDEALITYIMAASSSTHTIAKTVYTNGWALNGGIINGRTFYGITLPVGYDYGGPLFFAHYSFLGLDPRNLSDMYANYWTQNVNHTLINRAYCISNPRHYAMYSAQCWGLTASDNQSGYSAHSPTNDLGVITPTAALSSMPYAPEYSIEAMKFFYYVMGDKLWGNYGFYDAFNPGLGWYADSYLAIDQGPIVCMVENYRSGLLWDLFMSAPEVQSGLDKLGFTY